MCQFHVYMTLRSPLIFVFYTNITISLCANIVQLEIALFCDEQSRFIKNSENFRTKKSFGKIYVHMYVHEKYNSAVRLFK